jgi:hypothetical protein
MEVGALDNLWKKDWIQSLEGYFSTIPRSSYIAFLIVFACLLLTYSYYAIAVTLDQEGLGSITARSEVMELNYRGAARPLLWFVSTRVLSSSFMPVLTMILACLLLTWASLLYSAIFASTSIIERVIPALALATFPILGAALPLHLWNVALGLSYLTACGALYLVVVHGRWVIAAGLLALTFSNYQPSTGFFFAGMVARLIYVLSIQKDFGELRRLIIQGALAGVLGAALYAPVFLYFTSSASGYTAQQTALISSLGEFWSNLQEVLTYNFKRASGATFYRTGIERVFLILFFLYALVVALAAWKSYKYQAGVLVAVLVIAWPLLLLAATPIELVLEGQFMWDRAATALAIPVSLVCAVLLHQRVSNAARNLALLLSVYLVFTFVQYQHVSAFSQHMINKQNFALGNRIADRIEQLPAYDKSRTYTIVAANLGWYGVPAAGSRTFTSNYVTNVYAGQLGWYIGNHFKMIGLNNVDFNHSPDAALKVEKKLLKSMPAWPAAGSVVITEDDVIFVKF